MAGFEFFRMVFGIKNGPSVLLRAKPLQITFWQPSQVLLESPPDTARRENKVAFAAEKTFFVAVGRNSSSSGSTKWTMHGAQF